MAAAQIIAGLLAFPGRGAGTEAERRAARWLGDELTRAGPVSTTEAFWCRPNWALGHAWHLALGLAGSLIAVSSPLLGAGLILVALLSLTADALAGVSPGRRLTSERASQNIIWKASAADPKPVRVIITANLDAGRAGLAYHRRLRRTAARLRALTWGVAPGWLGWLATMLVWLEATAVVRLEGGRGTAAGIAQLLPSVVLVLGLAVLLEQGTADFSPAAGDNASGVAAAISLAWALAAAPPRNAEVELLLQGAGDGQAIGLRRYLRARRRALRPAAVIVIGVSACAAGAPHWMVSDGALIPRRYSRALRGLATEAAAAGSGRRHVRPHRARGCSPAFPAVLAGFPAIAIGTLDRHGVIAHSHEPSDTLEHVEPASIDRTVEFGLRLVDAIDAFLGHRLGPAAGG
jgi:hypothetical protein